MTPLLDLHTHTIASGHAYSTLQEMAKAASDKGLQILGITEHAPSLPGACNPIYFRNLHIIPREMYGVRLLLGAELNILDTTGRLDLDERHYQCCAQPSTPKSQFRTPLSLNIPLPAPFSLRSVQSSELSTWSKKTVPSTSSFAL